MYSLLVQMLAWLLRSRLGWAAHSPSWDNDADEDCRAAAVARSYRRRQMTARQATCLQLLEDSDSTVQHVHSCRRP